MRKPTNANENMLYSIVLTLVPTQATSMRASMGEQVHAAFLHTVREADPALAQALHSPDLPLRPFTVSSLQGTPSARNGQVRLSPERDTWLRFTILYAPIFERFMNHFLRREGRPVIHLGRATLLIKEILVTPQSHPWAGHTSWTRLAVDAQPVAEIALEFVSPTAFGFGQKAWGKKSVVLPDPVLVFGSLLRTWNMLAPPPLQMERRALMTYVEENVVVSRLEGLNTRMLRFQKSPQVGFTGRVTYGLMADNEIARSQLAILADFAFYAGVGMKTTMGMGQARRMQ